MERAFHIDDGLRQKITNAVFGCTLAILFMHLPFAGIGEGAVYGALEPLTRLAVPVFFAVSGLLLGGRVGEAGWYGALLQKRFRTLVVPYFLLNTLMIPFLVVYHNVLGQGNWAPGGVSFDWYSVSRIYGLTYSYTPAVSPLWYVRCLIFFFLLSPVLVFVLRLSKAVAAMALVGLFGLVTVVPAWLGGSFWDKFFYWFFNLKGLFYFAVGIALGYWRVSCGAFFARHRGAFQAGAGVVLLALLLTRVPFAWPMLPLEVLLFWIALPSVRLPPSLTRLSFTLYVTHMLVYEGIRFALHKSALLDGLFQRTLFVPVFVALLAAALLALFLRRCCPRFGQLLLGGRV